MTTCDERKRSCHRRRASQRRRANHLLARPRFLSGPLFLYRSRQYPVEKQPLGSLHWDRDDDLESDEFAIDDDDLQAMRDSVDAMQQQLRRGLSDIQAIRDLVRQAVAQRDCKKQQPAC